LKRCDNDSRAAQGKSCKSAQEIDEYFNTYPFILTVIKNIPSLEDDGQNHETYTRKAYRDLFFTTPVNNVTVYGKDF
jgi:hypothetical protein